MHEFPQWIVVLHQKDLVGQHSREIDEPIELISTDAASNASARIVDLHGRHEFPTRRFEDSFKVAVVDLLWHEFLELVWKLNFIQLQR